MSENKIKYKFDFGNPFKLIISYIVEIIENVGVILLNWVVLLLIGSVILEYIGGNIIIKIFTAVIVIVDLLFIVLIFIPKKVILTDDKILVYRFCFPLQITFWDIRGLNDRYPILK